MIVFIIGPSAAGKGTQADLLSEKYSIPHLSTGDMIRAEIAKKSKIGLKIEPIIASGIFLNLEDMMAILKAGLDAAVQTKGGAILDGFPRSLEQAQLSLDLIDEYKTDFLVVHYILSYEDCLKRQEARIAAGNSRPDDAKLKMRYDEYARDIDKIDAFYQEHNKLVAIDARPSIKDIHEETVKHIEEKMHHTVN